MKTRIQLQKEIDYLKSVIVEKEAGIKESSIEIDKQNGLIKQFSHSLTEHKYRINKLQAELEQQKQVVVETMKENEKLTVSNNKLECEIKTIESKTFPQLIKWWGVRNIKSKTFRQIFKRWWNAKN